MKFNSRSRSGVFPLILVKAAWRRAYITFAFPLILFSLVPATAHAEYFYVKISNSIIGTGPTREAACTNAVEPPIEWCAENVSYSSGRWYCSFRYTLPGTVCSPCTGLFCNFSHADILPAQCVEPLVYNPFTQQCENEIDEKNEPDCEESTNNPVNYSTGNKTISEIDFSSAGEDMLQFRRHWNSYNQKWLFSYRQYARITGTSNTTPGIHTVTIYRETGRAVQFVLNSGVWKPDPDVKDTLTREGTQWLYTMSSGDKEWFDGNGRLLRIRHANGRGVSVTYPTSTTVQVSEDYGNDLALTLDASGRITAMADPDGQTYRYRYNANAQLEYVSYPDATPGSSGSNPFGEDNPYRRYHYEDANLNLVTGITDENDDLYKTITYDAQGRATSSGLSDGTVGQSTFDYTNIYDAMDPRVAVTNALGKDTVYHLERRFGVSNVKTVEGIASTNCLADVRSREYYPENGWVKRKVDKAGSTTYYEYFTDTGRNGLLKKRVEGEGSTEERIFTLDWDSTTRLKRQEIVSNQKQTDYTYHPNGRLHTQTETDLTTSAVPYATNGNSRVWTTTFTYYDPGTDTRVKTMRVDGPRAIADATLYEYSAQGYLTQMTNAVGHVTQFQNHNGRGQPRKIIDPNGKVATPAYTPRGWLDSITQDVGGINALTDLSYDNVGQLTRVTLPDATYFDYEYDDAHRLEGIQNRLGERIEYTLDGEGNPDFMSFKDASNIATRSVDYQFDELSRMIRMLGSNGQNTRFQYDDKDHLESINDGVNPPTQQDFDALNRLRTVTDADNNPMTIAYDSEDRVDGVTDQRGLITDYIYDGFGNTKQVNSPDTGITTYTYDEHGNRLSQIDARNVVTNYTYDALNRLKTISYPAEPSKNVTYSYDNGSYCTLCKGHLSTIADASGVTNYVNDALGRIVSRINVVNLPSGGSVANLVTNFTYNGAGRLTRVQYPNGQLVKYTLDTAGQVLRVKRQDNATANEVVVANVIKYQPFGPLKEMKFGNNLQMNRNYDLDGRLATQTITGKQNLLYDYDAVNNIRAIENPMDPTRSEVYSYDVLNRLETATGKYGAISYDYDEVGNRIQQTLDRGGQLTTETYIYPQTSNRLKQIDSQTGTGPVKQRKFLYDTVGNLVDETRADGMHMKPQYDNTNRMDSVTP